VPSTNIFTIQRVYGRTQITFLADSARKAADGACFELVHSLPCGTVTHFFQMTLGRTYLL